MMHLNRIVQYSLAALPIALVLVCSSSSVRAQDIKTGKKARILYEKLDIRAALRQTFDEMGLSFSLAPEVTGEVYVPINGHSIFQSSLQDILRQVNATYYLLGGVYQIALNRDGSKLGADPSKDNAIGMDDQYLYVLRGSWIYKLQKSNLKEVSSALLFQPGSKSQ